MTAVQHLKRLTFGLTLLTLAAHASAQVQVTDAWVRATVPGQPSSGAFMTVTADSDSQDNAFGTGLACVVIICSDTLIRRTGALRRHRERRGAALHAATPGRCALRDVRRAGACAA